LGLKAYPPSPTKERDFPPILTGMIERLFFTFLIGFNVVGIPIAMMGWIAMKMGTNWVGVVDAGSGRERKIASAHHIWIYELSNFNGFCLPWWFDLPARF
jgi:hypothetical protein